MACLSDIGEFETLRRILAGRPPGPNVIVGAGDDAAVLEPTPGMHLVVTTDAFVEGVHYRPGDLTESELGSRFAAANLSDLAAMAARPRWGLVSMGVRPETEVDHLLERDRALGSALAIHDAALVGGNVAAVSGPEWMSLTLIGDCAPGHAWTRSGAHPGDLIAITGQPGRSTAGLSLRAHVGRSPRPDDWWWPLFRAFAAPGSRVSFARELAEIGAVTAAIDISDGFAADLAHVCEASAVGAEIVEADWPEDTLLERAAAELNTEVSALRTGPSDDYELLLAIRSEAHETAIALAQRSKTPFAIVGRFTRDSGLLWLEASGESRKLARSGYEHFPRH